MDKLERIIQKELSRMGAEPEVDLDSIVSGVSIRIQKRSLRRKTLFSAPVVLLLVAMMLAIYPRSDSAVNLPGSELLMAGWEESWLENSQFIPQDIQDDDLYDQSVDYLIEDNYYSYSSEIDDLFDDDELKTFIGYLEEV